MMTRSKQRMITAMKLPLALFATLFMTVLAQADVRLPKIFSDHMVLQRDQPVRVWGWASPGEKISVQFAGQSGSEVADKDGVWSVQLLPMKANATPHELTIRGTNTVNLANVLVGDVWMVGGQSNAAFGLGGCNAREDIHGADFPLIRFSGYWEHFAGTPQHDGGASWRVMSPRLCGRLHGDWVLFRAQSAAGSRGPYRHPDLLRWRHGDRELDVSRGDQQLSGELQRGEGLS